MRKSFTLVELIFVLVIIGILAGVAIPKFTNLSSNTKISSELATASTIESAIEDVHSQWIMSEGEFNWGNGETSNCSDDDTSNDGDFNCSTGYPILGECSSDSFKNILKNSNIVDTKWECAKHSDEIYLYKGPASKKDSSVKPSTDVTGKPDCSDYWEYNISSGTFKLIDNTDQTCKDISETNSSL